MIACGPKTRHLLYLRLADFVMDNLTERETLINKKHAA